MDSCVLVTEVVPDVEEGEDDLVELALDSSPLLVIVDVFVPCAIVDTPWTLLIGNVLPSIIGHWRIDHGIYNICCICLMRLLLVKVLIDAEDFLNFDGTLLKEPDDNLSGETKDENDWSHNVQDSEHLVFLE